MRAVLILTAMVGCYEPSVSTCDLACVEGDSCPAGRICSDGFCRQPGDQTECGRFELTINLVGPGTNRVFGPPGLDCPGNCTVTLDEGIHRLTAETLDDSRLLNWSVGDIPVPTCAGLEADCNVELADDLTIDVTFGEAHTLRLELTGDGSGKVLGESDDPLRMNFECSVGSCVERFAEGTTVTLTKVDDDPAVSTWGARCAGSLQDPVCTLVLDGMSSALVDFDVINVNLVVIPAGQEVFVDLAQVPCKGTCDVPFGPNDDTPHKFKATPDAAHNFVRWVASDLGSCDGLGVLECAREVQDDLVLIALFETRPVITVLVGDKGSVVFPFSNSVTCSQIPVGGFITCQVSVDRGAIVRIDGVPQTPTTHQTAWAGCPSELMPPFTPSCTIIAQSDHLLTATFPVMPVLTVNSGDGPATVTAGTFTEAINPSAIKAFRFPASTNVSVRSESANFSSWQQCPSGVQSNPCTVGLTANTTVGPAINSATPPTEHDLDGRMLDAWEPSTRPCPRCSRRRATRRSRH